MKKGMQWPIGVAVVLGLTVAANIYMVVRANDDPSMAIESDYYQKAVRFDADQALRRRSERLGWHLALDAAATDGQATVTARLVDSTGAPVHGAIVRFRARHVARSNDAISGVAHEAGDAYVATMAMARRGLWDVDVEVVRGNERFVTEQRLELPTLH
jgi:nitrogen fixation protein FixH